MAILIDLSGPEGNSYALIGLAKQLADGIGMSKEEYQVIFKRMTSSDYNNLLDVLVKSFPGYDFKFENDPRDRK